MPHSNKAASKRGGQRVNAGRKSDLKDPVVKSIRLEAKMVKEIQKKGYNLSEFLREAGKRRLDEDW